VYVRWAGRGGGGYTQAIGTLKVFIVHSDVGDYGLYQVHNLYCLPHRPQFIVNTNALPLNSYDDAFKNDI